MAEARALIRPGFVWQEVRDFLTAYMIDIAGGFLLLLGAVFLLWPIGVVLVKGVFGPEGFTLEFYREFFTAYYYRSFLNTLLLGVFTTSACIAVGFCIAYMTTRGPMFLRTPLKWITLLPLIAPPYMFALSLIILFGRSGLITRAFGLNWNIYGFPGVVLAQTLAFLPLAYLMLENALSSLDPSLEDTAANLGASETKIIRSIILPLLTPSFLKAILIVYVMAVAEFGNVAILSGRTAFLAPDIYTVITGVEVNFNLAGVLSMFLILPVAIIFLIQNYLVTGKSYITITGKPVSAEPRQIGKHILIPMMVISLFAAGAILLSFGVVGLGGFTKIVGINNTFTLSHMLDWRANDALMTSLKVSLLAGLFGAIVGVVAAYVVVRGKARWRVYLEGLYLAGFTLPGTVLGIGYLLAFNGPPLPLTSTMMILVINCLFRFVAVGMEAGIVKLKQVSVEVEEASLNLGANPLTTFRRIVLPIISPAALYGFIYVFMTTMVSLSAVVFLTSPGTLLASVFIFQWANYGYVGLASATTLKVMVIVAISVALIQRISRWTGLSVIRGG
ncbi:MAG: iron ABC transporter permease [Nitrospinota bacterium]|nr:MAG: iron ABC transporter permease [Nitrospinota bacterium]